MESVSAAVIGAGSQGRAHALGYLRVPGVSLTALADLDRITGHALARELNLRGAHRDHRELLDAARPEILSICTPVASHLEITRDAVAAGVRAIHCEAPIALSHGDALEMAELAAGAGVQLTFNLQRRFDPVQLHARQLLAAGEIGEVLTIEGYCPGLFDWGTHILDLVLFHRGDAPASWVMGQIDYSVDGYAYGAFVETASLTQFCWPDGVRAIVSTGREPHTSALHPESGLGLVIQGTHGRMDLRESRCLVRRFGRPGLVFDSPFETDERTWDRGLDPAIAAATAAGVADLVDALRTGRAPALSAEHGLRGAELLFATHESSRSRRRVPLPLDRHDNALFSGLGQSLGNPVAELRSTY